MTESAVNNSTHVSASRSTKSTIANWLRNKTTWPDANEFEQLRVSHFSQHCRTFYKRGFTQAQHVVKRLESIAISIRKKELAGTASQESISQFWKDNLHRLLSLAKTSDDQMLLKKSQSVLVLPLKEVNKYWHKTRCDWIKVKGESYRLGLTMCTICKLNMVKVIGGKCLRPEHANVEEAKKVKRKRDEEAKKRSEEKSRDVTCDKCNCTLHLNPKTKEVADPSKSKRCKVSVHQFLDVKRLSFDSNGTCDACNLLAG